MSQSCIPPSLLSSCSPPICSCISSPCTCFTSSHSLVSCLLFSRPSSQPKCWGSSGDGAERELSFLESFNGLAVLEVTYRTELCSSFFLSGYCEFSSSCMFAHSCQELRPRAFDPNYKTTNCLNYPNCPFGSRCKFIHEEFRVEADYLQGEYWLISPVERLVRIEIVNENNLQRRKFLQRLVKEDQTKAEYWMEGKKWKQVIEESEQSNPAEQHESKESYTKDQKNYKEKGDENA
jgi:hypothetical protein